MKKFSVIFFLAALTAVTITTEVHAQRFADRWEIRFGNRAYQRGDFEQSATNFDRALERNPQSFAAAFNLGNALYREERFDEAAQVFGSLAHESGEMPERIAESHYNAGNALVGQQLLREALEEYKNSLRANPDDMDAKFNLAYVKKLLEENEDENEDEDEDEDEDEEQEQEQNEDQNEGGGGEGGGEDEQEQEQQQEQERPAGMTEVEAQQMLDAIQAQEDRTQEKVDENERRVTTSRSRRNW